MRFVAFVTRSTSAIHRKLAILAVLTGFAIAATASGPTARAAALDFTNVPFQDIAGEILAGIGTAGLADIPANGGYDRPRIKLLPLTATKIGDEALPTDELHAHMLAELTQQGSRTYRFATSHGDGSGGGDSTNAPNSRKNVADVLIIGTAHPGAGGVTIAYQAVSAADGLIFAATTPRFIRFTPKPADPPATVRREPAVDLPNNNDVVLDQPRDNFRHDRQKIVKRTVVLVQRALFNLGYHPGPVDGVMRPRTRVAIRDFQRDYNLVENGRITRRMVRALRRAVGNIGYATPYQFSGRYGDRR